MLALEMRRMKRTYVVPGTEKRTLDLPKWNETWCSMRCLVAILDVLLLPKRSE